MTTWNALAETIDATTATGTADVECTGPGVWALAWRGDSDRTPVVFVAQVDDRDDLERDGIVPGRVLVIWCAADPVSAVGVVTHSGQVSAHDVVAVVATLAAGGAAGASVWAGLVALGAIRPEVTESAREYTVGIAATVYVHDDGQVVVEPHVDVYEVADAIIDAAVDAVEDDDAVDARDADAQHVRGLAQLTVVRP